ncbi:alkaline phosphatase PHO8 [Sugiyamaella lignohabitans]|uniref:Alkaline phosphatase n=1 Tax=Sugiyamaella lignohabitans TaxID=796027 RepID=A0A167C1X7_9ASCO|nr:alkaline phosphatase PHO8 [Sugiyamaella lignohabitans]ANB11120.1 alkaline phosphatase PHO8 [Sugiyamaella lignohabitans]
MADETLLPAWRRGGRSQEHNKTMVFLGIWATLATFLALYYSPGHFSDLFKSHQSPKRNVIFFVSDGMGPASLSLTRSFRQYRDNLPIDDILHLDDHFIGHSRTRSSDSLVTDSAAGATAFACGFKTYNGAIGVFPDTDPCGTVLEGAKLRGYHTGMVVTTRITDATPASFSAHVLHREEEDLIAEHQLGMYPLGRMVDLMIGGGRCHFLPGSVDGGCRHDSRNLVEEAVEDGWQYVENREQYDLLKGGNNISLPLLALLAPGDIPYDLDRDDSVYPSLEDTTRTAIRALELATKHSDKGFFLLVEGSRIDHAGHQNDPAAQVREVLAFDRAFQAAIEFSKKSNVETIVVSTSDHETGGLATARQLTPSYPDYLWYPEALDNATHSAEYLGHALRHYNGKDVYDFIKTDILKEGLGIPEPTEEQIKLLADNKKRSEDHIANIISLRSQTGWSTHGHSAVDVNVYGFSGHKRANRRILKTLGGSNENTDIGKFLADYLDVDVSKVTDLLQQDDITTDDLDDPHGLDSYHAHIMAVTNGL